MSRFSSRQLMRVQYSDILDGVDPFADENSNTFYLDYMRHVAAFILSCKDFSRGSSMQSAYLELYLSGFTQAAIARQYGVSRSTVCRGLKRALSRFRPYFKLADFAYSYLRKEE